MTNTEKMAWINVIENINYKDYRIYGLGGVRRYRNHTIEQAINAYFKFCVKQDTTRNNSDFTY